MSLHFTLEYVTKGGVDENITKMFVDALFNQDGLTSPPPHHHHHRHQIRNQFMAFGLECASVIQGKRNGLH